MRTFTLTFILILAFAFNANSQFIRGQKTERISAFKTKSSIKPVSSKKAIFERMASMAQRMDSARINIYDSVGNIEASLLAKINYSFDHKPDEILLSDDNLIPGFAFYRLTYTYLNNDQEIITTQYEYNGISYQATDRSLYYFNQNGVMDSLIYEYADQGGSTWIKYSKRTFDYTGNGRIDKETDYYWNNFWVPDYRTSYIYALNGNLEKTIFEFHDGQNWTNNFYNQYHYGNTNLVDSILGYYKDMFGGSDILDGKIEIEHDQNGNPSRQIFAYFDGLNYVYDSREEFAYDLSALFSNAVYPNLESPFYQMTPNEIVNLPIGDTYSSFENGWKLRESSIYFYSQQTISSISDKNIKSDIRVYPNPASDQINIYTPIVKSNMVLEIIDAQGRRILKEELYDNYSQIQIANYQSGIYFYQLSSDEGVQKGKFVKN